MPATGIPQRRLHRHPRSCPRWESPLFVKGKLQPSHACRGAHAGHGTPPSTPTPRPRGCDRRLDSRTRPRSAVDDARQCDRLTPEVFRAREVGRFTERPGEVVPDHPRRDRFHPSRTGNSVDVSQRRLRPQGRPAPGAGTLVATNLSSRMVGAYLEAVGWFGGFLSQQGMPRTVGRDPKGACRGLHPLHGRDGVGLRRPRPPGTELSRSSSNGSRTKARSWSRRCGAWIPRDHSLEAREREPRSTGLAH